MPFLASLCFGELIEIDFDISENGWDHYNATLIRVNLCNYINEGETIKSAALNFTGIQNYMEPEDDALHISLLKLNHVGQGDSYDIRDYYDNHESSNFFKVKTDNEYDRYTWMGEKSDLGCYTDDNDKNAIVEWHIKQSYWEDTPQFQMEKEIGLREGFYWRYERQIGNSDSHWWTKYSNWTTEDFDIDLDVATVEEFMGMQHGWFGIGIDADCHYTGNVKLVVETSDVPEPTSLSFLLLGFVSLTGAYFSRKRK